MRTTRVESHHEGTGGGRIRWMHHVCTEDTNTGQMVLGVTIENPFIGSTRLP